MSPAARITLIVAVLVVIAAVILSSSLFVVDEMNYAVVTQFGEEKRTVKDAGLYFKTPFVQKVQYLPKRILQWKGIGKELVTKDKTYIVARTWARWRIGDPLRFYQALRTEENGHGTLDVQIESATKDVIASHDLIELVRTSDRELAYTTEELKDAARLPEKIEIGREQMCRRILETARKVNVGAPGKEQEKGTLESVYGIELIDVQISQVIYVEEVRRDVYARMRAERERIAQRHRSEGKEKANMILGDMQKELKTISSEGEKQAKQLRGEGDAAALSIYAKTYSKDPEFYRFWKTLKTYEESIDRGTCLVLSLESDYFNLLAGPEFDDEKGPSSRGK